MNNSTTAIASCQDILPGQFKRFRYQTRFILIINLEGQFYALDDQCPHEDVSLAQGFLVDGKIQCPLHGSQFCVKTGQVQLEPAETNLHTYRLETKNDMIYITAANPVLS